MPGSSPSLSIAVVLPRGMCFSPQGATSIDLCAADFVRHSRHAARTRVICATVEAPFEGFDLAMVSARNGPARRRAVADVLDDLAPDVVVVHQHLPTAAALARDRRWPVVLHTHNFAKPAGWALRRLYKSAQYRRLASVVFVSQACLDDFDAHWGSLETPRDVVHNALDMSRWTPARVREKRIALVGRAAPEKGVLEATEVLVGVLARHPDWRATLALSATAAAPEYLRRVRAAAARAGGAIEIETEAPFARIQALYERAAIALVPSRWRESFGRTALEAHAGGAALVSTGAGGLREVSGEACLYASIDEPAAWAAAIERLIVDDSLQSSLREAGRSRAERHFDIRRSSDVLDDLYERVAGRREMRS
jgi:glycosyltransferase involved in cell wall biosynthesis